jgi:outer membrane protein
MLRQHRARLLAATLSIGVSLISTATYAYDAGDWVIRGRVIKVAPQEDSSVISITSGGSLTGVAGSGVTVDSDVVPELDITYMLQKHWGVELILGTSQHNVHGSGTLSSLGSIIDMRILPPTLTLQYHFLPDNNIRPYVGAGVNYVHPYNEKVTGGLAATGATVNVDDSFGYALQAGVDIDINKSWFVNFDVKYLDVNTTANFANTAVAPPNQVNVDVNPIVFGIGIGTSF